MFEYSYFNVWHTNYPEHKLTGVEAMCKRGAEIKGCLILKRKGLIPYSADKRRMKAQDA